MRRSYVPSPDVFMKPQTLSPIRFRSLAAPGMVSLIVVFILGSAGQSLVLAQAEPGELFTLDSAAVSNSVSHAPPLEDTSSSALVVSEILTAYVAQERPLAVR